MRNMSFFILFFTLLMTSCSMFQPRYSDELDRLSQECFKAKKGIEFQIYPIPEELLPEKKE